MVKTRRCMQPRATLEMKFKLNLPDRTVGAFPFIHAPPCGVESEQPTFHGFADRLPLFSLRLWLENQFFHPEDVVLKILKKAKDRHHEGKISDLLIQVRKKPVQ